MLGLATLPYEVLANVADNLCFDDIINFGRTSKDFQFLLTEERICKSFVQVSCNVMLHVKRNQSDTSFQLLTGPE